MNSEATETTDLQAQLEMWQKMAVDCYQKAEDLARKIQQERAESAQRRIGLSVAIAADILHNGRPLELNYPAECNDEDWGTLYTGFQCGVLSICQENRKIFIGVQDFPYTDYGVDITSEKMRVLNAVQNYVQKYAQTNSSFQQEHQP